MPHFMGRHGSGVELPSVEHGGFPKGYQFDPGLPQSYCRRVLEQDSEPLVAPGEQVGALHGFLCHRCMNVCVNG